MKIQKFNESSWEEINLQEPDKMRIRTIPVDVEFDFFIKKYAKGPEGNYYSVRVLLKNDSDSALLKTWDKANRLGDYILEKDIDNTINKYIDGISVEHRAIKKYNL